MIHQIVLDNSRTNTQSFKTYCWEAQPLGNLKLSKRWKWWGPTNPEDPSYKLFEMVGMGSVSFKKHEMVFTILGLLKPGEFGHFRF